ncbi:MAG: hypothetical protein KGP10_06660 [Actinomycetales bacterium]|nr:hypothetical protein [Actinomycetales bacterium]
MAAWGSYSYSFGPFIAVLGIGLLALLLRWTFRRGGSLIARPVAPGSPDQYGMLDIVAAPQTRAQAERVRARLAAAGIRTTLAGTVDGPRVFVWSGDADRARRILSAQSSPVE